MSRGRDIKAYIYYYARRGWHEQLVAFCDEIMTQKGKDPVTVFWKAYGLGKTQGLERVKRELEVFQNRRDLQLPLTTALLYFAQCQGQDGTYDREYVRGLEAELSVAEETAKDAGLVMTARFCLFVNDFQRASILSQKILQQCNGSPSTPFEIEAQAIDGWAAYAEACHQLQESKHAGMDEIGTTVYRKLEAVDDLVKGRGEQFDVDTLMLHADIKRIFGYTGTNHHNEVVSILNQIIAMQPQFAPVLAEKSILLASIGEWDHALEFAQRALDIDRDYYDALIVIAVHAFTQESEPRDAARKLEDVYHAYVSKESSSYMLAIDATSLFSSICARQPQALQTCAAFLQHAQMLPLLDDSARANILCSLGRIYLMQGVGGYESAMKSFKDASKLDPQCVKALEGMISCQLSEGLYEDAEAQIELVSVMHNVEDLSAEFHYLKAILAKHKAKTATAEESSSRIEEHVHHLNECHKLISRSITVPSFVRASGQSPFSYLVATNPDFLLRIAVDYMEYSDGDGFLSFSLFNSSAGDDEGYHEIAGETANVASKENSSLAKQSSATTFATTHHASSRVDDGPTSSSISSAKYNFAHGTYDTQMSRTASRGLEILNKLVASCPGMTCLYIEISRCFSAHRMFSDAVRVLNQCLALQPHSAAAIVALALVEIRQQRPVSAQSLLEQALSCDFSVRSVTIFRLAQAIVSAQGGKIDESLSILCDLLALPDIRSNSPVDGAGLSSGGIGSTEAPSQRYSSTGDYTDSFRLTNDDRVAAFIVHASLLSRLRRQKEASKILNEAKILFAGMAQETQILIASSQLAIERKDFDSAIRRLDKVEVTSPSYSKAQLLKAEILLTGNRDREGYTRCFSNLIDKDPSAKNYALLADAYLRILSPEAAIDALEIAYSKDPSNSRLRVRIGRALTATHEYNRAVKFYESAIDESREGVVDTNSSIEMVGLILDSAKLYVKLGRLEDALRVLKAALHTEAHMKDITDLQHDVTTLLLLSDVELNGIIDFQTSSSIADIYGNSERTYTAYERERISSALKWVSSAHEIQKRVVDVSRSDLVGVAKSNGQTALSVEKGVLSYICCKEATLLHLIGGEVSDADGSMYSLLDESLTTNPENVRARILLARVNLKDGEATKCRSQCEKSLQSAPSIEEEAWATILLSEALYLHSSQQNVDDLKRFETSRGGAKTKIEDTEDCIEDFESPEASESKHGDKRSNLELIDTNTKSVDGQLTGKEVLKPLEDFLSKRRCHYRALERMISLSRRLGLLSQIPHYLEAARQSDGRAEVHPGFRYCKGLYARFTNDIGTAILDFNAARGDDEWGYMALIAMIDLYLNPDQDYGSLALDENKSGPLDDISANNLNAADSLLQELKARSKNELKVKVLENYCMLANHNRSSIQHVLESFIEMLEDDHDYLPALLGLATAYMVDKEQHKAKNLLKRITKLPPYKHDGEDFSKANFLIARMNIDKGRFDVAQDAIKKILAQNRSSPGAWELMGLVMEKSQDYVKASECYEKAWTLNFDASAPVGFKLAYCFMKSGEYIRSIDICETVLDRFPQYPRIKEEILDTCVNSLTEV